MEAKKGERAPSPLPRRRPDTQDKTIMANCRVEVIITVIYLFIYLGTVATVDVLDHSKQ